MHSHTWAFEKGVDWLILRESILGKCIPSHSVQWVCWSVVACRVASSLQCSVQLSMNDLPLSSIHTSVPLYMRSLCYCVSRVARAQYN